MKKTLPLVLLGLCCLSSCRAAAVDIATYDFRVAVGDLKLKDKNRGEEAYQTALKLKKKFQETYRFHGRAITYYYDSSKSGQQPVPAVTYDYVYESTSFAVSMVQTNALWDGAPMAQADQQEYYCNGAVFYSRKVGQAWTKTDEAAAVKSRVEQFKPSMMVLSAASALITGGQIGKNYVFDQTGSTSQQDLRLVGTDKTLTYYYERMASNTFFTAYEFTYGDDFHVEIPADLPA